VLPPNARFCLICGTALTTSAASVAPEPGPPASPQPALPTAFANGRYQVKRFLGEGGKKMVSLVHDTQLDRDVAFSLIKTQGLDDVGVERIKREARLMGRLGDHPHIVSLYDIGEEAGQPFLVSQLMAGGDVEGLIEQAPEHHPPLEQTLRIAEQVCQALDYAHSHGIIHRDLKPGNVWLTRDGTAKLGDFGLAMAIDKTRLSVAGMIVGTVGYMPPEQALGTTPDARSDLYSLGAMLYEMVTGRPPFLGDDPVAIISQHLNTAPVAPSWHNPAVPKPLEALILTLLAKDPAERPASAAAVQAQLATIATTLAAAPAPGRGEVALPAEANPLDRLAGGVFVGREKELGELRAGVDAALGGQAQVLLLVGEPGIGKTRLAEELATYAALRGMQVLWGRNYEWEGAPAYWPWVQILRGYVHERDPQALRSELGQGAPDIAQLVSEIRERLPDIPTPPPMEPEQARFRLFDSITTFVGNASRHQPLLLVLDDLHWADKPSLLLLEFLARELGSARVLLVGTYRDVEVGRQHPLAQTLAELSRSRLSRRILVRGLPAEDVARFITLTAGTEPPPELVAAVHQETEGNPFFVTEVVRLLVAEGRLERPPSGRTWSVSIPESVREVVGRRLSRLSDECNQVLAVGSVIGREFRLATLERITGRPTDDLLELLEEAVQARVIHEQDAVGQYRFSHALVQETLYAELSTARRVRLHGQVGNAIEQLQAANLTPYLGELAQHYFQAAPAGQVDKAIDYAVKAAERAMEQLAWEAAVEHYQRALQVLELQDAPDLAQRCEILLALGDAHLRTAVGTDSGPAQDTFRSAAKIARDLRLPEQFTRAALGFAGHEPNSTRAGAEQLQLLEEALAQLPTGDSSLRAKLLARTAIDTFWVAPNSVERALALSDESVAIARRLRDPATLAQALVLRYSLCWTPDNPEERLDLGREIVAAATVAGDLILAGWGYVDQWEALIDLGRFADIPPIVAALGEINQKLRMSIWEYCRALIQGNLALVTGRLAEAEAWVERYYVIWPTNPHQYSGGLFGLGRERGRLSEVREMFSTKLANQTKQDAAHTGWKAFERAMFLALDAETGRLEHARAAFDGFWEGDAPALARDWSWLGVVAILAETAVVLGDQGCGALLYDLLLPYAGRNLSAGHYLISLGPGAYHLGLLATLLGRWDAAKRHFNDAIEISERWGTPPFGTRARVAFAEALVKQGHPEDHDRALALIDEALSTAEELGMTRLSEQALALKVQVQGILKA
jgi:tetratricopeptide (TPR) repeat protein